MKKIFSCIMSVILITGAFSSITAVAENDNNIVYTYINEDGERIGITQEQLDEEHWDVDLLGDTTPMNYKDFPVRMNPFVDDFANLSIEIMYLKNTCEFDNVVFTITDMETYDEIFNSDITNGIVYTNNLDMDGYYKLTITENFVGHDPIEYVKYISTAYEPVELSKYINNPTGDSDEYISIVDTEKISQATYVDEYGRECFDSDVAAFDNIDVDHWNSYVNGLENNKLYKIMVGSGSNTKTCFISTYDWGISLGTFIPEYTLYSEDIRSIPATIDFDPSIVSDNVVKGSRVYDIYGDEVFSAINNFQIYQYTLKEGEDESDVFHVRMNASDGFAYMVWYKLEESSTVVRDYNESTSRNGVKNFEMVAQFGDVCLEEGDTMYFFIYSPTNSQFSGSICIENESYDDDVSGSAYEQYINNNSIVCANFETMGSYADAKENYSQSYNLTDIWDVDTFYLNNTASSDSSYALYFTNTGNNTETGGMTMTLVLYYVDFDYDDHFVLKRQSGTSAKHNIEKGINITPRNNQTKYFLEVYSSDNDSDKKCEYDNYEFYTVFYPEG